jgi:plasmid stabilization system protein ParE
MRVIIREAAYDDLDRIYAWIAKRSAALCGLCD